MIANPVVPELARTMLSIVVVDDENVARSRLRRFLSSESDARIVAECANGRDAVDAIIQHAPALVFLDIEMPELTGFQVLDALRAESMPAFVFVTAYNTYAIDAFRVDALDYLLKPFDEERFRATMDRARDRIAATGNHQAVLSALRNIADSQRELAAAVALRTDQGARAGRGFLERIAVKANGSVHFVRAGDIDYVEAAANYVKLHIGTETHMIRETLGALAAKLDPSRFARIHRGTVVNLERIREIQPWFSGDAIVILKGGHKLRLSRVYRSGIELGTRSRL